MSVEAMAIVLHHSRATGTAKIVLIGIANHEGDGGAWPSMSTLATYANVSVRQARDAVKKLREIGEVEVDVQGGGPINLIDSRRPNRYTVRVICPPWCDRTMNHRDVRQRSAQSALWITPRQGTSGGQESSGDPRQESSGDPRQESSAEPSTEPATEDPAVAESTTDRAREYCETCGFDRDECERRAEFHFDHPFTPRAKRA